MIQEQKFYIGATGSSNGFSNRFAYHRYKLRNNKSSNPHLQESYNKNGLYNLEFSILEECNDSVLDEREQYWMEKYKNDYGENCLVNMQSGGKRGFKVGEEALKKYSEASKGEKNYNYGKHLSEETKQKLSEAKKGIPKSEEHKQKISSALKGKKRSPFTAEHKQKMSEAKKGENHPLYGKTGKLNPNYGSHRSAATKQKMSEAIKLYWQNRKLGVAENVSC